MNISLIPVRMASSRRVALLCAILGATLLAALPFSASAPAEEKKETGAAETTAAQEDTYKPKTKVELRRQLSTMQYYVTQEEGTEKAFRNQYWNNKQDGDYHCVVCELPLFTSATKFKSGTGWPSFYAPLKKDVVGYREDWKLFYSRTEVHCKRCGAHLGHVFNDGPRPTGKRYCMNSASLKFIKQAKDDSEVATDEKATANAE